MSKDILKQVGNSSNIPFKTFECDTEEDKAKIDLRGVPMGSRCFVIGTGKTYALNSEGLWKIVPGPMVEGGSGESGATFTPALQPVEDGNELSWTNDKGQANPKPVVIKDGKPGVYVGKEEPTDRSVEVWVDSDGVYDDVVTTGPQSLTPEQKTQVQRNISALTSHGITGAKIGDLMQITAVDENGVPTALKPTTLEELEGKWELIEQFTASETGPIIRTEEPDGTPYNFKCFLMIIHSHTVDPGSYGNFSLENNDVVVGRFTWPDDPTPESITYWKYVQNNGVVEDSRVKNEVYDDNRGFGGPVSFNYHTFPIKNITRLRVTAYISKGAEVELWGVRA